MPGPPPKPEGQRRRRNASPEVEHLPARGRRGRAPAWPLPALPNSDEQELWTRLWKTPQAVAWQRYGWTRVVARYVRVVVQAEAELDEKLLPEARQLEDRLGLTPMAMLRLRWEVDDQAAAAVGQMATGGNVSSLDDRRGRLLADG
jgi:hypothetical protein